jgi:pilus assembly protein CpaB
MLLRNLLLATGAFAFVLGVALLVVWLRQSSHQVETAQAPTQSQILIAAHAIPTGTLLRPEDMTWKPVAPGEISPDMLPHDLVNAADFVGAVARRDFPTGDPLLRSGLVQPKDRGFLAAVLVPGYRAVSISVDAPQTSSGLLMPGDHVDVILTQTFSDPGTTPARKSVGETVLHDIRVIAVDQAMSALARPNPATSRFAPVESRLPRTVTLEVSERDAERLFVATQLGKIELSVRALDGGAPTTIEAHAPVWASDVSPALKQVQSRAARSGGGAIGHAPIEVMHGSKTEIR